MKYDKTNPASIFSYSIDLLGHSLHEICGNIVTDNSIKGKGSLGQMVEKFYYEYELNSYRGPDFKEAELELKCTPLLKNKDDEWRIKERLVCTMIDYFEIVKESFESSHFYEKCKLMLILFYLHVYGDEIYDYKFIFSVLWKLPEKDLLIIKHDYETILNKVRAGKAHEISEGDTEYLGACRKGQKGDSPQKQPYSNELAPKRAFSLKPAYMRTILDVVKNKPEHYFCNFDVAVDMQQLVSSEDLTKKSFEEIIIDRFKPFKGKDYVEICDILGIEPTRAKNKYALIASKIGAANINTTNINDSEEFRKSGITMKTVRVHNDYKPKESMSFQNIDYFEIMNNDEWFDSELYEIFSNRFLFVVFKKVDDKKISYVFDGTTIEEDKFILDNVFFWTMPQSDLKVAESYWENIRDCVLNNTISLDNFWRIGDDKKFHVRPKAVNSDDKTENPQGGKVSKYCYWFNANYVQSIIKSQNEK